MRYGSFACRSLTRSRSCRTASPAMPCAASSLRTTRSIITATGAWRCSSMRRRVCRPRASRPSPDTISSRRMSARAAGWASISIAALRGAASSRMRVTPGSRSLRRNSRHGWTRPTSTSSRRPARSSSPPRSIRCNRRAADACSLRCAVRAASCPMSPKICNSVTRSGVRARRYSRGPGITTTGSRPCSGSACRRRRSCCAIRVICCRPTSVRPAGSPLDASKRVNATELRALALESYRHFAAKRMLARLGE